MVKRIIFALALMLSVANARAAADDRKYLIVSSEPNSCSFYKGSWRTEDKVKDYEGKLLAVCLPTKEDPTKLACVAGLIGDDGEAGRNVYEALTPEPITNPREALVVGKAADEGLVLQISCFQGLAQIHSPTDLIGVRCKVVCTADPKVDDKTPSTQKFQTPKNTPTFESKGDLKI
jgi:hypothetical protein